MNKLIEYSIKRPVSVLMYFSLLLLLGAISAFKINATLLPQTRDRWILVTAEYEGVRAEEIRKMVAIPLEENLSCVKGAKNYESVSRDGFCSVKIELKWGADAGAALLDANSAIDSACHFLPDDCPRPQARLLEDNPGGVTLCLVPTGKDFFAATDFAESELKARLLALNECSGAEIFGGLKRQVKVIVDSKLAAFYGLSLKKIAESLNLFNYDYPAGSLQDGENELLFKTDGTFKSFESMLECPLTGSKGKIQLKKIARLEEGAQKESAFCFYNSERCVQITALCKKKASPFALSAKVKKIADEINAKNGAFKIKIASDSSREIKATMKNLFMNALFGTAITFFLIYLFFKSLKIALLISSTIPFCILFCFLVLAAFGKSANIISLTGVTICLGMIVDNSIVAMESAIGSIEGQKNFSCALKNAMQEVSLPNTASTLTTIIAFVPIFFIGGIIGELFTDLGISVLAGMAFSLLYSFTFIPAASVLFLKAEIAKTKAPEMKKCEAFYQRLLKKSAQAKRLLPLVTAACLLLALALLIPMKKELQPKSAKKEFAAMIFFEPGTSMAFMRRSAKSLDRRLLGVKGVWNVWTKGGFQKEDKALMANPERQRESLFIHVDCENPKRAKIECEKIFGEMGFKHSFVEEEDLISERLSIKNKSLFFADNPRELSLECKRLFGNNFTPACFKSALYFEGDKKLMQKRSISPLELAQALKAAFDGQKCFPYYENGKEIETVAQFEEGELAAQGRLMALAVPCGDGFVPLGALGSWEKKLEESLFYRVNGKDAKIVNAQNAMSAGKSKAKVVSTQKANIDELLMNGGLLLFVTAAFLYCVLGAQTESFLSPLVYLTSVPPALFGATVVLAFFGSSLNINSIMAFVALFGTSVNNSIILREGGAKKMKSVLITTGTSVACLLPFAFDPFRMNPQNSLALAIAGGLVFSAAASLAIIPNLKGTKNASL